MRARTHAHAPLRSLCSLCRLSLPLLSPLFSFSAAALSLLFILSAPLLHVHCHCSQLSAEGISSRNLKMPPFFLIMSPFKVFLAIFSSSPNLKNNSYFFCVLYNIRTRVTKCVVPHLLWTEPLQVLHRRHSCVSNPYSRCLSGRDVLVFHLLESLIRM